MTEGKDNGKSDGDAVGLTDGKEGEDMGTNDGIKVRVIDGDDVGISNSSNVCITEGELDGNTDGKEDGEEKMLLVR